MGKQPDSVRPATALHRNRGFLDSSECLEGNAHTEKLCTFPESFVLCGEVHVSFWVCDLHVKAQKYIYLFVYLFLYLQVDTIQNPMGTVQL